MTLRANWLHALHTAFAARMHIDVGLTHTHDALQCSSELSHTAFGYNYFNCDWSFADDAPVLWCVQPEHTDATSFLDNIKHQSAIHTL